MTSKYTFDEIKNIYEKEYIFEGKGLRTVSKELGMGENTLRRLFQNAGFKIKTSGQRTGKQLSLINENIFNNWSNEMSYWLGFIAADGSVLKNRNALQIKLIYEDRDHLQKFLNFIEAKNVEVKDYSMKYQNGYRTMSYVSISNQRIKSELIRHGIIPNKSHEEIDFLNYIPENFKDSFIMGYFDGDGSISFVNKQSRYVISFCSNGEKFIQSILNHMIDKHGFNNVTIQTSKRNNVSEITWGSKKDLKKFKKLYFESVGKDKLLQRKVNKFCEKEFEIFTNET